ncbi:MAG TPA: site-specific integrase, partial [Lysobacter sp.]
MTSRTPSERRMQAMALPPVPDADSLAIDRFLDALWAENGLARPTLDSYRRDLQGFARWRQGQGGGLAGADRPALFDYLALRAREDYSPRSNARLLSAWRAFFAWCVRLGTRSDDPTALLQPPKLPRSLPKALAESEIEALLAAPEVDT